jgi:hypothetical protein
LTLLLSFAVSKRSSKASRRPEIQCNDHGIEHSCDFVAWTATTYDSKVTALTTILANWQRTDITFADRLGHISGSQALNY